MEAGKLTVQSKPFEFHEVFKRVLFPFRAMSNPNLEIVADYDSKIDAFSPVYLGDDQRLTQVIGNLVSNACKFTPSGTITIKTRLIYPTEEKMVPALEAEPDAGRPSFTSSRRDRIEEGKATIRRANKDIAIIRIEIVDTGVGIRPRDLVDNRLFSPYVQVSLIE